MTISPMKNAILALYLTVSIAGFSFAEEFTVKQKPFQPVASAEGILIPTKSTEIAIAPEVWVDFKITSLVEQGQQVKKGDVLIGIDTEALDKQIEEIELSRDAAELSMVQKKHEVEQLKIYTPLQLEAAERAAKEAAEDLKWYEENSHPRSLESIDYEIRSAKFRVYYYKEELRQLMSMYGEDNKMEETEEIIIQRTKENLEQAEFSLEGTLKSAERSKTITIPRKQASMKRAAKEANLANESAQKSLPRTLELAQLELAKMERADKKAQEKLAKLKADRKLMEITAPNDGFI